MIWKCKLVWRRLISINSFCESMKSQINILTSFQLHPSLPSSPTTAATSQPHTTTILGNTLEFCFSLSFGIFRLTLGLIRLQTVNSTIKMKIFLLNKSRNMLQAWSCHKRVSKRRTFAKPREFSGRSNDGSVCFRLWSTILTADSSHVHLPTSQAFLHIIFSVMWEEFAMWINGLRVLRLMEMLVVKINLNTLIWTQKKHKELN